MRRETKSTPCHKPARVWVTADSVCFCARRETSVDEVLEAAGVSKGMRTRLASEERLTSAERPCSLDETLFCGQEFELALLQDFSTQADTPDGATRPAQALLEDAFLLVANKPKGILVHSDGHEVHQDTLTARVRLLLAQQGAAACAQAVQRLDVETTGCTLFSRLPEFQAGFDALVAGHSMRKLYLAVVRGALPDGRIKIDAPLARDRHDARRMRVSPSGKDALSYVSCLARAHGLSLALVELKTGRRHQIRVHLAARGWPIVGDPLYGQGAGPAQRAYNSVVLGSGPQDVSLQLHCWRESFEHPVTGEYQEATAPVPESFNTLFGGSTIEQALMRWERSDS